jgi:metallo-beta-lactamase class B
VLKSLPCDVFLGAHGAYFDLEGKFARRKSGADVDVWIDPDGYRRAVAARKADFEAELAKQRSAAG